MANNAADDYETLMQFLYRAPVGLVQISSSGAVEMMNPMSSRLLMPLSVHGDLDNLYSVLDPIAPQLRRMAQDFAEPSGIVCEALRVGVDVGAGPGAARQVLSLSLLKLDAQRLMLSLTDVTLEVQREQEQLARKLQDAARVDLLTGMPNRAAVRERLQYLIENQAGGVHTQALLLLNCDRFRQINDALGHDGADQLLCMMAERMRATLRQNSRVLAPPALGDMVARIGADEFAVLLDGVRSARDAETIALRLLDTLHKPYSLPRQQISCNVSMGLTVLEPQAKDPDALLQDAGIAMKECKRAGGARPLLFEPAMRERAQRRGTLEAELRQALARHELFPVYQPVVGLRAAGGDGGIDRCAGVEALVRWRHPERGIIAPGEFIGIAEECGLIGELGETVLFAACVDFMRWQRELGKHAPRLVAVNVSRAQLSNEGLVGKVRAILQATGMPAHCLQLEVTESLAAQDDAMQQALHALKALGVKLALDDFGTGYSSLACLHLLPVDTVKLDRSFICQAESNSHHQVLIEATVMVAHNLGMRIVAEGVETEAQSDAVRRLGCDKGQGYFYSKPLNFDALSAWLRDSALSV
ncbi:putative bifunctional diguanylate cyclase/phosphodiesterase [Noviherbaspirillum pedocola]|uniref:Bifunctional diguanylate cyclase/phosphodiesterase n=1 Tax=Noviherbaspirillum pedocola TaxID=2801341 RepID=A0A934SYQ8_9BURK|nr:bifunctional diguanylate cyclase/phosphodiesterase [Noviherbaspirillum pedocola]MBK4738172.1 bifunctional diguanylate cyclase/phosphodiesterase [Noviherbaspirillum pedocola]